MPYAFDPEFAPMLALLPDAVFDDLDEARASIAQLFAGGAGVDTTGLTVTDLVVPGLTDNPSVPVRSYRPEGALTSGSAILYVHAGGFMFGSIDMEHAPAAMLARRLGATVVSVEYRLAPEDPFPAAIEDCFAALTWLHEQAESLGVDPARIAVVGNSAGGGLAAGLALLARDRRGPALCFQYLGIPELDHRLETPSMRAFVDTPMWNRPLAERSWAAYLGENRGEVSPYASPAVADDLSGLPPTYISVMEFDPLRDEGIHYALRLLEAGVQVELHAFPGTFHGSRNLPAAVTSRDVDEMLVVLERALRAPAG